MSTWSEYFGYGKKTLPGPDDVLGMSATEILHLPQLQYQLLFLAAVHGACSKLFRTYATGAFQAKSAVMAHYVPFLICFVGMAAYGDYLWLADETLQGGFDKTWGFHAGAEAIVVSMLAVQLYDIPVSLSVDDLRVPTFIAHHFAVLYLAVVVLKYRCFYYYAVYFLGVIETSSPFLALVDAFRDFPALAEAYPQTNEAIRYAFIVAFFLVRVVFWVPCSAAFWRDATALLDPATPSHGVPDAVVYSVLLLNLGLTLLQFHWASLIGKAAKKMLLGDTSDRAGEAKRK